MTTTAAHIEPSAALRAWLVRLDLLDAWQQAKALPTPRCDYYRGLLLRAYIIERRKAERSQRFQIERTL